MKYILLLIYFLPSCFFAQEADSIIKTHINNELSYSCVHKKNLKPKICSYYGPFVSKITIKTDKKGKTLEENYFDTLGNHTYDYDSVFVIKYKYSNSNDLPIETRYYYLDGKEAREGDFTLFDKKNRILEKGKIRLNDTARINFWKTTYNKKGNPLSEIFYKNSDSVGES